jgi:hypothetical protein
LRFGQEVQALLRQDGTSLTSLKMIGIAPKLSTAWRSKGMWRWRNSYSDPNVSWLHTRVLVSNLLHNPADNRGTINSFCKTAIIDRLLGRLAEKRGVSAIACSMSSINRLLQQNRRGQAQ